MRSCTKHDLNVQCPHENWSDDNGVCGPLCMLANALCQNLNECPRENPPRICKVCHTTELPKNAVLPWCGACHKVVLHKIDEDTQKIMNDPDTRHRCREMARALHTMTFEKWFRRLM